MQRLSLFLVCLVGSALGRPSQVVPWSRGSGRIIGGTNADIADYPWQVSFQMLGQHNCGASIISSSWVLTAAHCVDEVPLNYMSFRVGSSILESGGTVLDASTGYMHGYYDSMTTDYDIAVVQVSGSLLGTNGQAVGLPDDGFDPAAGLAVTATGWGRTTTGGDLPTTLQKVDITVADRSTCEAVFGDGVTERMVCAGVAGKSVCNGDSGGPLVSGSTQVGIVSWGSRTCEAAPAVYTNVGNLRSWVQQAAGV